MMTERCGRCANISGLCAMVGCGGFVEKAPLEAVEEIANSTQQTNGAGAEATLPPRCLITGCYDDAEPTSVFCAWHNIGR